MRKTKATNSLTHMFMIRYTNRTKKTTHSSLRAVKLIPENHASTTEHANSNKTWSLRTLTNDISYIRIRKYVHETLSAGAPNAPYVLRRARIACWPVVSMVLRFSLFFHSCYKS